MATPPTDLVAAAKPADETPKTVTVRVLTDTPVNRVRKGGTLSLDVEIAKQFAASKLVEILKDTAL